MVDVQPDSLSLILVSHGFQYFINAIIISIIIIYFILSSIELAFQNKIVPRREKKAQTIQDGDRKCGTHARVSPQTLAHGNSKNEKVTEHKNEAGKKRIIKMERNLAGQRTYFKSFIH